MQSSGLRVATHNGMGIAMESDQYVLSFEAVKTSVRQTKDGYHLTLVVHPNDVPKDLFTSWVGSRYQCALVQLDDQNQPVEREDATSERKLVATAGQLCRSPRFQAWVQREHPSPVVATDEEGAAAERLREMCEVESRAELAHNPESAVRFNEIKERFVEAMQRATRAQGGRE